MVPLGHRPTDSNGHRNMLRVKDRLEEAEFPLEKLGKGEGRAKSFGTISLFVFPLYEASLSLCRKTSADSGRLAGTT